MIIIFYNTCEPDIRFFKYSPSHVIHAPIELGSKRDVCSRWVRVSFYKKMIPSPFDPSTRFVPILKECHKLSLDTKLWVHSGGTLHQANGIPVPRFIVVWARVGLKGWIRLTTRWKLVRPLLHTYIAILSPAKLPKWAFLWSKVIGAKVLFQSH